ncbi:4-coumarate--CoA ligase 1-like [Bombyx mandarina]|uniref:4-coumarate--CoA ligase 1-like n=1 Tax=Bombyx mandarina TaxID=7092 RepID=A0A6J2JHE9_BOMMA|nr:4-coumarate--CoA ligase 1-like [Bombyx mandarina]
MLKNPYYVYGSRDITVPLHLNFGQFILDRMWMHKDRIAQTNGATGETMTYGEIVQQSMRFAISLSQLGVRKGERIAILSENRQEFWTAVIGPACVGAIITTISTNYAKGELKHAMNISKPKYVIISPKMHERHVRTLKSFGFIEKTIIFGDAGSKSGLYSFDELLAGDSSEIEVEKFTAVNVNGQNDVLFMIYSSGTTGLPKGVLLTHYNVIAACCLPVTFDPKLPTLSVGPWYHVMGLVGSITGMASGRIGVYLDKFDVELYLKTIERYKVVQLTVVPPILVAVCKSTSTLDLGSVRLIYSGAAPLHKDTAKAAFEKFPNLRGVFQGYGSSETTLGITRYTYTQLDIAKPGSVGLAAPGCVLKIVDIKTRQPLGPNQTGEICAKGALLMKGYIGRARSEDFDDEDFYRTGDVGYYDEDGHFYICDRIKELIKYKGYQVPPAELEAVLLQHEAVKDAGVVGIEDRAAGEVPLAFVVRQPGKEVTEQDLKDFVARTLSNPKHLRGGVRFVTEIPKNPSGKILRQELRKLAKSRKSKL